MNFIHMVFWKKTLAPALYGLAAYFSLEFNAVGALWILMLFDMAVGVGASYTLGEDFHTKKLLGGFFSKMIMMILPMTLALIAKVVGIDLKFIIKISIGILAVAEGISIVENLLTIKQKKRAESHDIITPLLTAIRKILEKIFTSSLEKISGTDEKK